MTFEQLKKYIDIRDEIEFRYHGKEYSITYWYPNGNEDAVYISFCEFYKETTEVRTASELWNDVSRDGITVGEMLSGIRIRYRSYQYGSYQYYSGMDFELHEVHFLNL